jgi:3-phosphoshikimate 1-carboxyvinyltransferase
MAAGALGLGEVEVSGLEWESPQADRRIVEILRGFGARVERTPDGVRVRGGGSPRALEVDLHEAPDLAPLVGALGCTAPGRTRVHGAAHLRLKESDRIEVVVQAARALGCTAQSHVDGFEIHGPAKHGGRIATHGDHRIAMAFAVAGLAVPGVSVDDVACVRKSYPAFWDDLRRLTSA